jgi:hypothetical protein
VNLYGSRRTPRLARCPLRAAKLPRPGKRAADRAKGKLRHVLGTDGHTGPLSATGSSP